MSDADRLGTAHGLALLDRLHEVLAKFKAEESGLARRLRDRRQSAQRASSEGLEHAGRFLAEQAGEAGAAFAAEKARVEAIHARRRSHIKTVANTGIRNVPKRAREQGEKWLGELQMRHFVTTRRLQAEREAAEARHEQFLETIKTRRSTLRKLDLRAREYFLGYPGFLARFRDQPQAAAPAGSRDELLATLEDRLAATTRLVSEFRAFLVPKIFSIAPLWAVIPLIAVVVLLFLHQSGQPIKTAGIIVLAVVALLAIHRMGRAQSRELADAVVESLAAARGALDACETAGIASHERTIERIESQTAGADSEVGGKWDRAEQIKSEFATSQQHRYETRGPRALARNDKLLKARLERIDSDRSARLAAIEAGASAMRATVSTGGEAAAAGIAAEEKDAWSELTARWRNEIEPIYADIAAMNAAADATFADWSPALVESWTPPVAFLPATKFARLDVDIPPGPGAAGSRLELPGPAHFTIPLALTYPGGGSLLFEVNEPVGHAVISCLNQIILRLLATTPPGKLSFTILDPVGLGQSFAGLMHLGDYEESLISRRIWTQSDQIDARLAELNQHIEKIIQMYLRDEYATIVEYNAQAGSTAERYHFLVIADFPANFSETAIKRLQSIVTSGPRCGVYTLIHWDTRHPMASGFVADELRASSICIEGGKSGLFLENGHSAVDARLTLDTAPPAALALEFVQKVGASSIDANQVQVPFRSIAPAELWQGDTTSELRVAIGRTGATKHQILAIGKGTRQHALVAGKTGSGKSTLFHVIITNLALSCSPEQVEFYLIDFKKGVEFKCYATKRLPHARVVAIESDREFGLSVLQRVDDELRRRGDLFRKLGVQDIAGYKRAGGGTIPRTLLMIDEFQELFVEDDSVAQSASVLLDRIVRQGRAFGIHVLLGSQTLGGSYSLARTTLGQMVIRIALQCNEADAYLIMDDNNPAPRLLSRPGEGIYNDAAGAVEGNSPFQVCWLPDEERDTWLDKVRDLAGKNPALDSAPIVFEGNAPADIGENALLADVLRTDPAKPPAAARAWIGAPNSIKGPTEIVFRRQSGNNLLVVGQRDEAALALLGNALLAIAAQYPAGSARFAFLHSAAPGSADIEYLERLVEAVPQDVTLATSLNAAEIVNELSMELKQRMDGDAPATDIYVFIQGLHRFRKLRYEDDFDFSGDADAAPKPGAQLAELIAEGSAHGIHILTSVDTFNSVNRFMNRKALSEFEMRVIFQMSANDSASLIDSPKAGGLGLHRALFYNEHEGTLETFRPYATPDAAWLARARKPVPSAA